MKEQMVMSTAVITLDLNLLLKQMIFHSKPLIIWKLLTSKC